MSRWLLVGAGALAATVAAAAVGVPSPALLAALAVGVAYALTARGLSAVLAVALGSGGNATFVLAVQILRLVAMLVVAAPIVRILGTRQRPS